jgi:hypothetical protein
VQGGSRGILGHEGLLKRSLRGIGGVSAAGATSIPRQEHVAAPRPSQPRPCPGTPPPSPSPTRQQAETGGSSRAGGGVAGYQLVRRGLPPRRARAGEGRVGDQLALPSTPPLPRNTPPTKVMPNLAPRRSLKGPSPMDGPGFRGREGERGRGGRNLRVYRAPRSGVHKSGPTSAIRRPTRARSYDAP